MLGLAMSIPISWVVELLAALEPAAPWQGTYEKTAEAIVHVAESEPLFAVEDRGEERTASLLVALAWFESRLKPNAKSKNGRWYCLYQIDKSYLGPEPEKALTDPEMCTRVAVRIIKRSLSECRARPLQERLAIFMSGVCDRGGPESRYRMFLANKLLREHPVPVEGGGTSSERAR
jgi:hypothetical protein